MTTQRRRLEIQVDSNVPKATRDLREFDYQQGRIANNVSARGGLGGGLAGGASAFAAPFLGGVGLGGIGGIGRFAGPAAAGFIGYQALNRTAGGRATLNTIETHINSALNATFEHFDSAARGVGFEGGAREAADSAFSTIGKGLDTTIGRIAATTAVGAAIGSFFPIIGTGVGTAVGLTVGIGTEIARKINEDNGGGPASYTDNRIFNYGNIAPDNITERYTGTSRDRASQRYQSGFSVSQNPVLDGGR